MYNFSQIWHKVVGWKFVSKVHHCSTVLGSSIEGSYCCVHWRHCAVVQCLPFMQATNCLVCKRQGLWCSDKWTDPLKQWVLHQNSDAQHQYIGDLIKTLVLDSRTLVPPLYNWLVILSKKKQNSGAFSSIWFIVSSTKDDAAFVDMNTAFGAAFGASEWVVNTEQSLWCNEYFTRILVLWPKLLSYCCEINPKTNMWLLFIWTQPLV